MCSNRSILSLVLTGVALTAIACFNHTALAQAAPVIEEIEPSSGPPGTVVNIIGRRFTADSKVSLGAQTLLLVSSLPNRLSVRIAEGVQSGNIAVSGASGTVHGPEFRVTQPLPAPTIDGVQPAKGPPGTLVVIRGKHFSALPTGNVVTLAGQPVVVRSAGPDELQVIVPEMQKSGPFVVRVQQGAEAASKASFEVTAATSINDVQPPRGGPGAELTIRGRGFSKLPKQNRVYLNNSSLAVKSASETEIVVQLPAKVASGKLLVDVQGAGRAYSSEPFVIQRPPTIADVAPLRGAPGTMLSVRGTNFGTSVDVIEAKLGEVKLIVREARDTSLRLEIPENAPSEKLSIRVQGVGPAWSKQALTVLPVLKVASFTPQLGPAGTEVTIEGQGFGDTAAHNRVSIGGQAARVLQAAPTRLQIRVPKAKSGPIQVAVAGNGDARSAAPFVITVPPEVKGFTPDKGPVGTELSIKGTGFGSSLSALKVTLGGQLLELKSVRDDLVVARVTPGAKSGRLKVEIPLQGTSEPDLEFTVVSEQAAAPAAPVVLPAKPR